MKLYIAMPLYGSGMRFPTGVFDSREKAMDAQKKASHPGVLEVELNELERYGEIMEGLLDVE